MAFIFRYLYYIFILYIYIYIYIYIYVYIVILNIDSNIEFSIKWRIISKAISYKYGSRNSDLCLAEKVAIARYKGDGLLNKRTEL